MLTNKSIADLLLTHAPTTDGLCRWCTSVPCAETCHARVIRELGNEVLRQRRNRLLLTSAESEDGMYA